jgi:hypothetical protein
MFRRKRKLDDFTSEIVAHLQLEIERSREQGLSEEEAQATARRSFGNLMQAEERFYESGRWLWWDHFWHDFRYALRMLRKSPGFTIIAVLTIALGIGATTAIFSVVDAVLLQPLPFREPDRLVRIFDDLNGAGAKDVGMSVPELEDLRRHSDIFEQISAIWPVSAALAGGERVERIELLGTSPSYFELLGAKPALGAYTDRPIGYLASLMASSSATAFGSGNSAGIPVSSAAGLE